MSRRGVDEMRDLDRTCDFIGRIQQARSAAAICDALLSVTAGFGLDKVIAGTIPPPGTAQRDQVGHLILSSWPAEWIDRYVDRNYIHHDPVVRQVNSAKRFMSWQEACALTGECSGTVKQLLDEARGFGLVEGFAFVINTLDHDTVLVSFGGEAVELAPEDRNAISFASAYAIGHALSLRGADRFTELNDLEKECIHWAARGRTRQELAAILALCDAEVDKVLTDTRMKLGPGHALHRFAEHRRLTPREQECLQWAALGKSEWEISQILGISEHTAEKHLLNAKTKLGSANRTQAVAEALRIGIIE